MGDLHYITLRSFLYSLLILYFIFLIHQLSLSRELQRLSGRKEGIVIYLGPLDGMFTRMGMDISILRLRFFFTRIMHNNKSFLLYVIKLK